MYNLKAVDVLKNNDKYIGYVWKHKIEQKYCFGTVGKIIWSNNTLPSCIPKIFYGQVVYLFPEVHDVLVELDEKFDLQRLG